VCDDVASKCPQWLAHCVATHKNPKWKDARMAWRSKQLPAANAAPTSAPSTSTATNVALGTVALGTVEMLKLLEQAPPLIRAVRACLRARPTIRARRTQVYPAEVTEPQGLLPTVKLRPYQKQSLAFMLDLEQKEGGIAGLRHNGRTIRGGMLCDEMARRTLDPDPHRPMPSQASSRRAGDG